MAGVPAIGPDGTPIIVPETKVGELVASGGHVQAPEEAAAQDAARVEREKPVTAADVGEGAMAFQHAGGAGFAGALGVPLDAGEIGIAGLFGKGPENYARTRLRGFHEQHPYVSGAGELGGNVAGALVGARALGNPGVGQRGFAGLATRMTMGGAENVIQATTKDINEDALGDHASNGQKLLAAAPERFLIGTAFTGAFEGVAHVVGKGIGALRSSAVPALEAGASRAVGREVGMSGEEGLAAGQRIRGLNDGEIPTSRKSIADLLGEEQGSIRRTAATERAGVVDAMGVAHQGEASGMALRHAREAGEAAGAGERGILAAERTSAEGSLEGMARGGARVEEAELAGLARRQGAHGESFEANMSAAAAAKRAGGAAAHEEAAAATAELRAVEEHYGVLRQTLAEEHGTASRLARELADEHASTMEQLAKATKSAEEHSGAGAKSATAQAEREVATDGRLTRAQFDEMLDTYAGFTGRSKDPSTRWAAEQHLLEIYGEPIEAAEILAKRAENVAVTGSKSSVDEVTRLKGIADQLEASHKSALKHVDEVAKVAAKTEAEAARDLTAAGRIADTRIAASRQLAAREAGTTGKAASKATSNVARVEAEVVASIEKARAIGQKEASAAEKKGSVLVEQAKAEAAASREGAEKVATKERASMASEHESQIRKIPKASEKTNVDPLLMGLRSNAAEQAARPFVSGAAGMGAVFSAAHGNLPAAAGALIASFAAGRARAQGNLAAARAMRALSEQITSVDNAVRNGTLLIMGRAGARAANAAENQREHATKQPSFETISKDLYAAQGNPLILERRVRDAMGTTATDAPQTYTQTLAATQKAHSYLLSILPPPQKDPYSLTPQLLHGTVDETTKYDFMRSFATVTRPLSIYQDVADKTVTESQIDAIAQVYPDLYAQMRAEVDHQRVLLKEPMDYDREIHIGTLLGLVTNEVLEPEFQDLLAKTYKDKSAQGQMAGTGSKSGGESKRTKGMMSGSESIEGGS